MEHRKNSKPVFVTLGPRGTNHELVTQRYIAFRKLHEASITLIDNFYDGLSILAAGDADFMVQVAVHPECSNIVSAAHFDHGIHVVDTFISPSKELGIVTRKDVTSPSSIGLQPATKGYADLSLWDEQIAVPSIMDAAKGVLEGVFDSALTAVEVAHDHPDEVRIDVVIGSVDDPWLVYGKQQVSNGTLIAWPDSPVVAQFKDT